MQLAGVWVAFMCSVLSGLPGYLLLTFSVVVVWLWLGFVCFWVLCCLWCVTL